MKKKENTGNSRDYPCYDKLASSKARFSPNTHRVQRIGCMNDNGFAELKRKSFRPTRKLLKEQAKARVLMAESKVDEGGKVMDSQ